MSTIPLVRDSTVREPAAVGGRPHVAYVLMLLQATTGFLASFGMALLMGGNPVYLLTPLIGSALLVALAARVARGRRWALVTAVVVEVLMVTKYQLNLLVGLAPQVDVTVNPVSLLTNVALPVSVLVLCLTATPEGRR
jgi:hypothetical protein